MYVFEYFDNVYEQDINLVIKAITDDLIYIKKYKKNLTKFAYTQTLIGKILYIDFERIINETHRINLEIDFLEEKLRNYMEIKEKQQ